MKTTIAKISKHALIAKQAREILELTASLPYMYHAADMTIDRCSMDHLMASGVVIQLTGVGGKELICPVMIKDGLSQSTIEAIKADIRRSYELTVMFKPKGV